MEALAHPECEAALSALPMAVRALELRLREICSPNTWLISAAEADFFLEHLFADPATAILIVHWLDRFAAYHQSFYSVTHRYVDPRLDDAGCVVVLRIAVFEHDSILNEILELCERKGLERIVVASIFEDLRIEQQLTDILPDELNRKLTYVSLYRTDADGIGDLRDAIASRLDIGSVDTNVRKIPRLLRQRMN
jgi:hypothetical protein